MLDEGLYKESAMALFKMEQEQITPLLSHIYGDFIVQIGGDDHHLLIKNSPIPNKVLLSSASTVSPQILFDNENLPLLPDSTDVIVLSHFLDRVAHPKKFLKAIHHTLVPHGEVIIIGINPMSILGLRSAFSPTKSSHHFRTQAMIKHWLRAIGFRLVVHKTFCFVPTKNPAPKKNFLFMEAVGQLCIPHFGGIYLIMAQKRVFGLTPLQRTAWSPLVMRNSI